MQRQKRPTVFSEQNILSPRPVPIDLPELSELPMLQTLIPSLNTFQSWFVCTLQCSAHKLQPPTSTDAVIWLHPYGHRTCFLRLFTVRVAETPHHHPIPHCSIPVRSCRAELNQRTERFIVIPKVSTDADYSSSPKLRMSLASLHLHRRGSWLLLLVFVVVR
jgi:hypothetical protein